jgi:protocatechuate 3,4-dioxygenase beta subunit
VVPSNIAALAAQVTKAMLLTNAGIGAMIMLAACAFVAGTAGLAREVLVSADLAAATRRISAVKQASKPAPAQSNANAQRADDKDTIRYCGRVLDPDGKPVVGAKLYLRGDYKKGEEYYREELPSLDATTGPDGRFQFAAPSARFGTQNTVVAVTAPNYGFGWVEIPADGERDDLTLQLVKDDIPITGQVLGPDAKPVAGATLRLVEIRAAPREDLRPWIEALQAKRGPNAGLPFPYWVLESKYLTRQTRAVAGQARTDGEGRFRLTGIGRNRVACVQLDGPTVSSQYLRIMTRASASIEAPQRGEPEARTSRSVYAYYGADFRHACASSKPILGMVRDRGTKQPLAGVIIRSLNGLESGNNVQTITDARGHYCLTGMPTGADNTIALIPPRDLPYVAIRLKVPETNGQRPVTTDFELQRGVWIEGKVTDKASGEPVRAHVEYFAHATNPHLRAYPGLDGANPDVGETTQDGSYRIVGLPGPGFVAARSNEGGHLSATERDDEYATPTPEGELNTLPCTLVPRNYGAIASVNPAAATRSVKRNITLDPGWTFTGTVIRPDGKPLLSENKRPIRTGRGQGFAGWPEVVSL